MLDNEHGKAIFGVEVKLKEWENYITNVVDDERNSTPSNIATGDRPLKTRSEVAKAIRSSTADPDEIPSEIYKLTTDSNALEAITSFFNIIYNRWLLQFIAHCTI